MVWMTLFWDRIKINTGGSIIISAAAELTPARAIPPAVICAITAGQHLQLLAVNQRTAGAVPQPLEGKDNQRQPGGLNVRHDDPPVDRGLPRPVDPGGFQHLFGKGTHEVHHQVQAKGRTEAPGESAHRMY